MPNAVPDPQELTEAPALLPISPLLPQQGIMHIVAAYRVQALYHNNLLILVCPALPTRNPRSINTHAEGAIFEGRITLPLSFQNVFFFALQLL